MNTILTIIIPVYNVDKYIYECLESLEKQLPLDGSIQIFVIDDGSIDNSEKIIKYFVERNNYIKYFKKENGGVSSARNFGLNLVKSDFVTFIDSDDFVSDDYIQTIMKYINSELELLCFNFFNYTEMDKSIGLQENDMNMYLNSHDAIEGFLNFWLLNKIRSFVWNKIFRMDIIEKYKLKFNESKKIGEDTLFTVAYLEKINHIQIENKCLVYYRNRSDSVTRRYNSFHVEDSVKYIECFQKIAEENNYEINTDSLMNFYISRWFGVLNNEAISQDYLNGKKNIDFFMSEPFFKKNFFNVKLINLSLKSKIYYLLMRFKLTYVIYTILYFRYKL